MARFFTDGDELMNKKDFDSKVNINQPLYKLTEDNSALTTADLFQDYSNQTGHHL